MPKAIPGWGKNRERKDLGDVGVAGVQLKVEAKGKEYDSNKEIATEIEDLDLSGLDEGERLDRVPCPRCEKQIPKLLFNTHRDAHSSEILPWLFLGSRQSADNDKELTVRTNITHILNVATECELMRPSVRENVDEYLADKGLKLTYQRLAMTDTKDQSLLLALPAALAFINEAHAASAEHRILVHCVQGISRSASVVIAYLMHEGMSLRTAYEHTKARRSIVEPRREFLDQLGQLERTLFQVGAPTLTSDEVFAGRTVLDIDAPLVAPLALAGKIKASHLRKPLHTVFEHGVVTRKGSIRGLTEEEREAKAKEMRERANSAGQAEAARWAHWHSLTSCDIKSLDWRKIQQTMIAEGGRGGVVLVELEGKKAVCIKKLGMMAVAEFLAQQLALCLQVRVASFRILSLVDEEMYTLLSAVTAASCMVPEQENLLRHVYFHGVQYLAVMEFVPGFGLQGARAQEVLQAGSPELLTSLGRLCAFDLVINNYDRLPLPTWSNDGNLSNVLVTPDGVVAIDQHVSFITHPEGRQNYMKKLRSLVDGVMHSSPVLGDVCTRLQDAFEANCGTRLSNDHMSTLLAGFRAGLRAIAQSELRTCLEQARNMALQQFSLAEGDVGLERLLGATDFVEETAAEIRDSVHGAPAAPGAPE